MKAFATLPLIDLISNPILDLSRFQGLKDRRARIRQSGWVVVLAG